MSEFFNLTEEEDMSEELRAVAQKWWTPDPKIVSKLPRGGRDPYINCTVCGGRHKTGAIHLDFVGHADLTRALIEIDPEWTWEPVAFDEDGLPRVTRRGDRLILWGRVTLLHKTMLAVGSCELDKSDADKELVGDMLRNAGMRFGIFGDLWSKVDGWHEEVDAASAAPKNGAAAASTSEAPVAAVASTVTVDRATPPDKPLAAMTVAEMLRWAESIGVHASGSKADILRTLEPYALAQTGEEPFDLEGAVSHPRQDTFAEADARKLRDMERRDR